MGKGAGQMQTTRFSFALGALLVSLFAQTCFDVAECAWPEKPITVYVGWSAGGSSDVTIRATCLEMEKVLGQRILVTNITGALGSIGATKVAKAPADGYRWFGGAAVHGTWPILGYSEVSWTNFYPLLSVVFPTTIYVKSSSPWKTLEQFIADIKKSPPGKFKFGSPGAGSNGAIFGGLIMNAAGMAGKVQPVPYKGGREAGRYLLSGDVNFVSVTMGDLSDWAVAGRIRPLVNLYGKDIDFEGIRFPSVKAIYPELVPFQVINPYFGIYVRRDTPPEIVTRIAKAFAFAIKQKSFLKRAVKERAGVLAPLMGRASDEQMAKIESARGWALYDLKIAANNPAKFGVPKLKDWSWPPHERAKKLKPWPREVEKIFEGLK
jgi:tripartite-type tricarboxylate transporter receptor subunit TctC